MSKKILGLVVMFAAFVVIAVDAFMEEMERGQ